MEKMSQTHPQLDFNFPFANFSDFLLTLLSYQGLLLGFSKLGYLLVNYYRHLFFITIGLLPWADI